MEIEWKKLGLEKNAGHRKVMTVPTFAFNLIFYLQFHHEK